MLDPRDGRWLQRDPIGYAGGWNLHQYASGDPFRFVDPDGAAPRKLDPHAGGGWGNYAQSLGEGPRYMVGNHNGRVTVHVLTVRHTGMLWWADTELTLELYEDGNDILPNGLTVAEYARPRLALCKQSIDNQRIADVQTAHTTVITTARAELKREAESILKSAALTAAVGGATAIAATAGLGACDGRIVSGASAAERAAIDAAGAVPATLTSQVHHAVSAKVFRALEEHRVLSGKYKYRDPRLTAKALDLDAHRGYQGWHRDLDDEVARLLRDHGDLTEAQFEAWLRDRYAKPDLKARFPQGLCADPR